MVLRRSKNVFALKKIHILFFFYWIMESSMSNTLKLKSKMIKIEGSKINENNIAWKHEYSKINTILFNSKSGKEHSINLFKNNDNAFDFLITPNDTVKFPEILFSQKVVILNHSQNTSLETENVTVSYFKINFNFRKIIVNLNEHNCISPLIYLSNQKILANRKADESFALEINNKDLLNNLLETFDSGDYQNKLTFEFDNISTDKNKYLNIICPFVEENQDKLKMNLTISTIKSEEDMMIPKFKKEVDTMTPKERLDHYYDLGPQILTLSDDVHETISIKLNQNETLNQEGFEGLMVMEISNNDRFTIELDFVEANYYFIIKDKKNEYVQIDTQLTKRYYKREMTEEREFLYIIILVQNHMANQIRNYKLTAYNFLDEYWWIIALAIFCVFSIISSIYGMYKRAQQKEKELDKEIMLREQSINSVEPSIEENANENKSDLKNIKKFTTEEKELISKIKYGLQIAMNSKSNVRPNHPNGVMPMQPPIPQNSGLRNPQPNFPLPNGPNGHNPQFGAPPPYNNINSHQIRPPNPYPPQYAPMNNNRIGQNPHPIKNNQLPMPNPNNGISPSNGNNA
jgi:hypothetical protein